MKRLTSIFFIAMMALCMAFTSCKSCSKPSPEPEPVFPGYNFDEVILSDYECVASEYDTFAFREADARFDSVLFIECDNRINCVISTFQCNDMVNMFIHTIDSEKLNECIEFAETIETWKEYTVDTTEFDYIMHLMFKDAVLECGDLCAQNPVSFDSCMQIVEPYKDQLSTRVVTLRRFIDPRLPENPLYVFGNGILTVDAFTGEVGTLTDTDEVDEIEENCEETVY